MAALSQEDVLFILKLLEESAFDELELENGDIRIHASKRGRIGAFEGRGLEDRQSSPAGGTKRAEGSPPFSPDMPAPGKEPPLASGIPGPPQGEPLEGLVAVRAPMLGTFYRTPKPGAPPFVEVGAVVEPDDPVGIIEVMKLFNTVKAGVQGRIVRICAEQGQLVEYQQVLFLLEKGTA
jgi:acetyl-CoA carboxylase biotin carboxyl carrier protein